MASFANTDRGKSLMSVSVLLLILVSIVVPLRVYVRTRIVHSFGPDDWAILIATVLGNGFCCLTIVGLFFGFSQKMDKVSPEDYQIALMINWVTQLLFFSGICIAKISVSLFIRRLSPYRTYARIAYGIIAVMVSYTITSFVFVVLQCRPVPSLWDRTVKGKCLSSRFMTTLAYAHTGANIATDFALLALSVAMVWKVQMPRRQKYAVYGVFFLGSFASLASVIKVPLSINYGKKGDYLYDASDLILWSIVELQAGIIATSLPTLKPLIKKYLKRALGSSDQIPSGSERTYPLQYLSPPTPKFPSDLATMDGESEQCIVFSSPVRTPETGMESSPAGGLEGHILDC